MRIIDADYVKSKLNKSALGGHLHYYVCGVIDDAPTIDAEPVKHARWVWDSNAPHREHGAYKCSNCGCHSDFEENYCYNCGYKMDLKDGETK